MRYFLDTEFNEDGKTIDLISLGIYGNGRGLYLISNEFDEEACQPWVKENVLPKLGRPFRQEGNSVHFYDRMSRAEMREAIVDFVGDDEPTFWGYFIPTDWVAFYQLWGRLLDLPDHFPKMCWDLKQLAKLLGSKYKLKDFTQENAHNALDDAAATSRLFDAITEGVDPRIVESIDRT